MNKKIIAAAMLLVLLVCAAAYKMLSAKETGITATGTVETTRADITPKVGGYLTNLSIKAGDTIRAGDLVTRISRPDLEAQALRDEAALIKAQVQLSDLEKGSRSQERQEVSANLDSAQSVYNKASADLNRYTSLYASGAISSQQLEAVRSAFDVARSALTAAQAKQSLAEEGYRPDTIEAQRLEVTRSKAILDAARSALADTQVASPLSGLIVSKNFENGEYVNPGSPIATVIDLTDCWVKVYVSSSQLGLISIGQSAAVKIDAYPDRIFSGQIKEISQNAEFTPRQSITQRERANLVFAVKVKIDNPENLLKPGMPADVVLQ